jgi:hypothetical protein
MQPLGCFASGRPIHDIAFRRETRQVEDADPRVNFPEGRRDHIGMLPASLVIVRQDDDIGSVKISCVLGPNL